MASEYDPIRPDPSAEGRDPSLEIVRRHFETAAGPYLARPWSWLAGAGGLLPRSLADHLYDGLARRRRRWFRSPPTSCPRVSPRLLARFDP